MKVFKRFMAMLLCLAMVATLFAGLTLTASAAGYSGTGDFKKATGTLTSGYYVFGVVESSTMHAINNTAGTSWIVYTDVSISSSKISNPSTAIVWYYDSSAGTIKNVANNNYIYWNSGNAGCCGSTAQKQNIAEQSSGIYKVTSSKDASRVLRRNGTSGYRYYTSATGSQDISFYKLEEAPSKTLSSIAVSSNHRTFTVGDTFVKETVTATYSDSTTADVTNSATFSAPSMSTAGTKTINVSYTEGGTTKSTSYTINVVAPTPYTLTYSVNGDTSVISSGSYTSGSSVSLPANVTAPAGYTFAGWVASAIGTETTTAPTVLTGSYTMPAANTTLYALFTRTEGGSGGGSSTYQLVTSASDLVVGSSIVIAAKDYNYAISTTQNSNNRGQASITKSGNTITLGTGVSEFTLEEGTTSGTYSFKDSNGYLYAASSSSNNMKSESSKSGNSSWTISISSGTASVTANGSNSRKVMQYNQSSSIFSCYSSASQKALALYQKTTGSSGTTYYTTTVNTEATYYTLTYGVNPASSGSIACDVNSNTQVEEDEDVILTATPATHFTFKNWTVTGTTEYVADGNEIIVTMTDDVNVVANFEAEPTYTVTIVSAAGGTMTASKTTGIYAGETITLTATPNAHYSFNGWQCTAGGASISGSTFTMPAANVTITGSFTEAAQYTVTFYDKDGHVAATKTYYAGETIPASDVPSIIAPDGFVFKNWYSANYSNTTEPAYTAPAGATVNGNMEFHAVYAELGEGGSSETFKLEMDGDYVGPRSGSNTYMGVASSEASAAEMGYDVVDGKAYLYYMNNGTKTYIYNTSSDTSLAFSTTLPSGSSGYEYWIVEEDGSTIAFKNGVGTRYLALNGDRFSTYTPTATQYPCEFTKIGGASVEGYTTNPVSTKISVTWMNGTETFDSGKVAFGDPIVPPENDPTKTEAEQEYYTFAGWSETEGGTVITSFPTASAQLGDKTYYAVFTTNQKLTVTWKNYDNTTLDTDYCKSGDTPVYEGTEPTKPADSSFYYTFSGWTPTVSAITSSITYTATFEQHDRFEMSASLSRNPIKVGKYGQVNTTLTDTGVVTTEFTPTYTVADSSIVTVDATGKITAKAIGSTTITVTYPDACDANGDPLTKTLTVQVIENASVGGYTLITEDMEDWSGDYIFAGRRSGRMADLNNLMIMTPGYGVTIDGETYAACLEDGGGGSGLGRAENNASWLDLDISGTEATGSILSAYGTDDIVMSSTGDNDAGDYMVLDYIDEIDDSYAFTIELVDDINGYYTIRIKGTNYYLANDNMTSSGNNSLGFAFSVGDSTAPLWKINMYPNPVTTDGYTPPIVSITSVMNDERAIFFNPHEWTGTDTGKMTGDNEEEQARFRTYGSDSATSAKVGGTTYGGGNNYSLYLYGNPNPFKAQIYYKGDQITIAESGKVNANAATAQLTSALTPDIMNYPSWSQVGDPVWTIVENSDGNHMTIDSGTGLITTNSSSVGSYALVQVAYTVHDNVNNVNHVVSTISKVDVIAADTTYSTVIYELYSGDDTEVQYTIPNSMTELPLAAYVVNDATNDNSKTGDTVMGGTLSWSIVSQHSSIFGNITIDSNGVLHLQNVNKDSVVTVKVTGATGDNTAATDATYKVYIKAATYTVDIVPTPDSAGTHDTDTDVYTVPGSADTAHLTYNVKDGNGNGPSSSTFTTAGYAWTISGDAQGALINSNGVLDFSEMDRSEDHTITVVVSRIAATDVNTGVISSGLTDTITVVVKADLVEDVMEAVDDLVIVDYALPVTFNVLTNDNINVTVDVTAGTLPSGVVNNGEGEFTFTPSGWLTTDQTYDYTIAGTVNGTAATDTATVTLKTADAVYYEDTYSGIFTFTGNWTDLTDGTAIAEQTSSLDTADIFEYDANYENYAQYSGGTAKTTTVVKGNASKPSVTFTFAGTGFDVISATTNNGGAVLMTIKDANGNAVKDPVTGRNLNAIYDNFRGYVYCEDEYTRYTLDQVRRGDWDGSKFTPNPLGDYYWDRDNFEFTTPVNGKWYALPYDDTPGSGTPGATGTDGINLYDCYSIADAEAFFAEYEDETGNFIIKEHQSHWKPYEKDQTEADDFNTNFYQIPIMKITGLPYGTYTVTLTPTYSAAYDRAGDNSYDFIFDGVRIHNPVANRDAEYKYINIADAVDEAGMGSGVIVTCDHKGYEWTDWTFYSRARNTNSATTCNRGSFVQYCTYCGGVANTAYFHVNVTADDTDLGVGGYMGYPSTTMLRYTLTADECENQAAIQAKLDALTGSLTEYWSSNTRAIMTCMNNSNVVIGSGEGTTYATLQLKDPITQTIYASAIHSPMITVYADEDHVHTFGDWTHDADSDPSTHTHTCTDENCSFYETEECVFTEEVTLEPTQTTPGSKTCTCALCGYSYVEEIPALGGHTATFHVPEGASAPAVQTGNSVTMPAAVAAPADFDAHNYTFIGWIGNTVSDTTTEQSFYAPGYAFDLDEDMDFYALYTYEGEGSGNTYKMVTSEPANWEGKYIIVNPNKDHAMSNTLKSGSNEINASAITVTDNKVVNPSADLIWELTKNPNNASQYSLYNAAGDVYAGITGTSSTNASLNSTENFFTIEETGTDNVYDIASVTNSARCFSYYGTNETFRTYAKSTNNTGYLFKQAGALTYTTNLAATCKHTDTTTTTVNATCTEAGSTTVTCDDCGEVISVTPIAALGHDYQITSSNATGTTYTCSRCGDSFFEPAEFEVTYVLQPGVTVSGNSRNGNAITLPTAASIPATYDAHDDYELVGWTTASGSDTETDPSTYEPGEVVNITADTTFHPVYKFTESSGGTGGGFTKATSIAAGDTVILVCETAGMEMTSISTTSTKYGIGTSFSGTPAGTFAFTVETGSESGSFSFKNGSNYLRWNSGNSLDTAATSKAKNSSWYVTFDGDGNAKLTNANDSSRFILWNKGSPRFATYAGQSVGNSYYATQLYKSGGSTTTTYTFELKSAADSYSVTMSPATLTLFTEASSGVTAMLFNNGNSVDADDYAVEFSSSNDNIVMVDEDTGYVLAGETAGTATITATVLAPDNNYYTATCAVTVKEQSDNVTVNYIGSSSGNVYNWGTRGTTATFLTELADNYYTGSYSYDTLSALSGSSSSNTDFYNSALGTAIHNMLVAKQKSTTSYDGTKTLYAYTDCVESDTAHISSYYSAVQLTSSWDSAATWNREHTWPKSKALSGTQGDQNDIMMLRPTSVNENGDRGNLAYGESSGYYDPNSEGQQLHGDVARLMLQHLMRWGNTSKFYGTGGVMESRAILLKWLAEDPVDTWELGRNDAVERITGVRNVFVDYPELAFILLGAEVPANYTTPSKSGIVSESTYSATRPSGYEPVTEAANTPNNAPRATAPAAAKTDIAAGTFNGIAIIDGKGASNVADDQAAYGPEHGVYLAPGQGIVFSLVSDIAITSQDLQIGAKAVNGTATAIDVASISNGTESSGIKYLLENKAIASATEMYYELDTTQMGWNGTESSVLVIYNSGEGVLDVTNIRYSTVNGNTLTININDVESGDSDSPKGVSKMQMAIDMIRIVYGEPITDPDPIEPTDDLDLNFKSAELVLNSDIAINFNVEEEVMDSADSVYAVFTKALYNEAGEITGYAEETVSEPIFNDETGLYSFRFTGINPAEMGSAVTATLYGYRDDELVSGKTINYSVLDYINRMYGKVDSDAFNTLLADLAAYGAAAQNYISYNTANLVTDDVTDGLMSYATADAPELNNATAISGEGAVAFTGAYLSLREKVTVCYMIDASEYAGDVADLELRIFDGNKLIGTAKFDEVDGKYVASFSGLNALQMRTVITAEVYDGDTCVSNTLDYSIESYAAGKAAGNDALAALVNAMMNFGISAETYFAK